MNRVLLICLLLGGLASFNNAQNIKEDNLAKEAILKDLKDSLALDSFRKAEVRESALKEQEAGSTEWGNISEDSPQPSVANTTPSTPVSRKKGWSDAAKGTAIGAGVGAGMGVLIDKDKRIRGAAIGAAIGGASGYAIGRKSDRQSGRVQKK